MFMKHTISRFFRFFLVAALVAAMAGSLLPSKALGQETPPPVNAVASTMATDEAISWTITFNTDAALIDGVEDFQSGTTTPITTPTDIALNFSNLMVNGEPGMAAVTAPAGLATVNGVDAAISVSSPTVTVTSPSDIASGAEVTITLASNYVDDPGTDPVDESEVAITAHTNSPTTATNDVAVGVTVVGGALLDSNTFGTYNRPDVVSPKSLQAGQSSEWEITSDNHVAGLSADADRIAVTFSSGTVPSSIARDEILVRTNNVGGTAASARLSVTPTVNGRTISFLSPVDSGAGSIIRIVISSSAGIAAGNSPGGMAVMVRLGTNIEATSVAVPVGPYLNISPRSASRNATVTVTGGGFTPGTSGGITVGDASTGGTYSVDSSGKLSGSFVVSAGTKAGGAVSVLDLGNSEEVVGPSFTQLPSAVPSSTEVARGDSVSVSLNDFPEGGNFDVTVGGLDAPAGNEDFDYFTTNSDTSGTLNIPQSEARGTKQVVVERGGMDAKFLITVTGRTLTVSPSSAVPGQAITVSGSGFAGISTVDLLLTGVVEQQEKVDEDGDPVLEDGEPVLVSVQVPVDGGTDIKVTTDGTFLYTGRVPFNAENADAGSKTWKATGVDRDGNERAASSSGFAIQKRAITLSPSTANPGSSVEVFGSGWGVTTSGNDTSQVTLTIEVEGTNPSFGPFPISSTGEFVGAITVPLDVGVTPKLTVRATDNNATLSEAYGDQTVTKSLTVPTGVITVNPDTASTGTVITVTGTGFPAQTNLSALSFGDGNALPVPAPATDVTGDFTVTLTVPAAQRGGSLQPGAVVITARVGQITGTISFTIPGPEITLSTSTAAPGETISVSGTNFSAYSNVGTINVGIQNQAPTPNPLTDSTGDFSASVLVPALNPGAYTVTVRTANAAFTATAPINIVSSTAGGVTPETAFQALTSRGLLTLAAASPPGGTEFGAFVPGLAGNTLVQVDPNGVLILTLNADARISVSSQPAVDVAADTPTFFALGANVSVEVIE